MPVKGRHILITGAGKRVGRCLADAFLKEGAHLTAHYHHSQKAVKELESAAKHAKLPFHSFAADLKDTAAIQKGVKEAISALGPVSILINSASAFHPTPAATCTPEQWDDLLATNLRGQFFMAQSCYGGMKPGSVILNITDIYATTGLSRFAPYAASKAGLLNLTRTLAQEWAPHIRVNAISPGPILFPENYTESQKQRSRETTLLGREGSEKDILEAARFLIENAYVTGMDLVVDGGRALL